MQKLGAMFICQAMHGRCPLLKTLAQKSELSVWDETRGQGLFRYAEFRSDVH